MSAAATATAAVVQRLKSSASAISNGTPDSVAGDSSQGDQIGQARHLPAPRQPLLRRRQPLLQRHLLQQQQEGVRSGGGVCGGEDLAGMCAGEGLEGGTKGMPPTNGAGPHEQARLSEQDAERAVGAAACPDRCDKENLGPGARAGLRQQQQQQQSKEGSKEPSDAGLPGCAAGQEEGKTHRSGRRFKLGGMKAWFYLGSNAFKCRDTEKPFEIGFCPRPV
eukprot:1161102-Pelagomonas_calceolata.AAC.1